MNGKPKQMTEHETKRASWLFMHPRADGAHYTVGMIKENG